MEMKRAWIAILLAIAICIASASLCLAKQSEDPDEDTIQYELRFVSVQYDENAKTSQFNYEVKSFTKPAISHWVLGLCADKHTSDTVLSTNAGEYEIGTFHDVYGIKFDEGFADNEVRTVWFILDGLWETKSVQAVIKGGHAPLAYTTVIGPSCEPYTPDDGDGGDNGDGDNGGGDNGNGDTGGTVTAAASGSSELDLTITKDVDKSEANTGDILTYVINYRNSGKNVLEDVQLADNFPTGTSYVSGSASNGGELTADGKTIIWNIGHLDVNAGGTVSLQVKVNDDTSGELKNVAVIRARHVADKSDDAITKVAVKAVIAAAGVVQEPVPVKAQGLPEKLPYTGIDLLSGMAMSLALIVGGGVLRRKS